MSEETRLHRQIPVQQGRVRSVTGPARLTDTSVFKIQQRLLLASATPELFMAATEILGGLPGTIGAWIYGRDDQGGLSLMQSWAAQGFELEAMSGVELSSLIHLRWIAAHRSEDSSVEFVQPFSPQGFPNRLVVPMLLGGELVGAIVVERRDAQVYPYAPEDLTAMAAIATTVSQSLQILVLRDRLLKLDQPVQQEEIAQRERRSLARELHDGILQDLAYFHLKLVALEKMIPVAPEDAQAQVRTLCDHVDRSIMSVRQTTGELRRPARSQHGITGQLRELASGLSGQDSDLKLELAQLSGVRLAPEIERAVVGIVREALQNIRKHASASRVHVDVQRDSEHLCVVVSDDGVGMEDNVAGAPEGHFGIDQMRELAEDMGGSLHIDSTSGTGTRVLAQIPLGPAS